MNPEQKNKHETRFAGSQGSPAGIALAGMINEHETRFAGEFVFRGELQ